jgi:hypothetical protein
MNPWSSVSVLSRCPHHALCDPPHKNDNIRFMIVVLIINMTLLSGLAVVFAWIFRYQNRRDSIFTAIGSTYGLHELDSASDITALRVYKDLRILRGIRGTINGKDVFVADCYQTALLRSSSGWPVQLTIPNAFLGARTIFIVDGRECASNYPRFRSSSFASKSAISAFLETI